MKLQQLRCVYQIVQNKFNISKAAESLHTSQPGVSKQIQLLEDEVGIKIFQRNGKRLTGLSDAGNALYKSILEIIREVSNIKNISNEYEKDDTGIFTIATTHTQARYKLPKVVEAFVKQYPKINLNIHQGNPSQVTEQILKGDADVGIATESIGQNNNIICIPCYSWNRVLVFPKNHSLMKVKEITLQDIASYPLITYDYAFTGSTIVSEVFKVANISPNIMLTAIDADVIKTYVELDLGVGLIAEMAYDKNKDSALESRDVSHLFPISTTFIGIRKDTFVRGFVYDFIKMFTPHMKDLDLRNFLNK
ncbi:CysB family HTH-type transcriptional regulator [Methylophilaceae bacterium]|jgi:LysR family transcriptional regulator, cys regulon transcriptional activator|nr:CysB family HTH-type transcriptional regulator [Methylophilaceae bacterium]|tara:strand:+ start:1440 stop:2360 length:921 start_codon:yes stop_codon:yes gene_type:complete